jgi:hypothetical protein
MKRVTYLSAICLTAILVTLPVSEIRAQKNSPISVGADFVSRYVWRGLDFGASPSIQPSLSASFGGFTVGAWGAYAINSTGAQEMDLYVNYTFLDNMVTVGMTDYFFPNELTSNYNWFDWANDSSGHILEGMVGFNGTQNLPLSVMFGFNFYGDDSYYIELGYSHSFLNVFLGMGNGAYTAQDREGGEDVFGVVNLGITATKNLNITENYSLPVYTSLITNPNAKLIHLVFGMSF